VYKWTARKMIERSIARLNAGDIRPALAVFADDAVMSFPGRNSWARQFREPVLGRERFDTHRGKQEIRAFLERYVAAGLQMEVEDILVNGPPWNMRAAVRVRDWSPGDDGRDRYCNRAVLFVTSRWGRIVAQEDYEDTERAAAFDELLAAG
jgi:ketosteroid isomerase-like protein